MPNNSQEHPRPSGYRYIGNVDSIVIHHTNTPDGEYIDLIDLDEKARIAGKARTGIVADTRNPYLSAVGVHYLIKTNGVLERGRWIAEIGDHINRKPFNECSLAIAMVGTSKFYRGQWHTLRHIVTAMNMIFGDLEILGHQDLEPRHLCPGFSVKEWIDSGFEPLAGHILEDA